MVICLHYNYVGCGGLWGAVTPGTTNYYIAHFTEGFSIIACNLFAMISGYYLSASNKIKIRKVMDIILLLVFYGVAIYIFSIRIGLISFSYDSMKLMISTINSRWFVDIYLLLYLIHPFLNKLLNNISKKQLLFLIAVNVFCFYLWPSITKPKDILIRTIFISDNGYGILNFITLYFISYFIRTYQKINFLRIRYLLMLYIVIGLFVGYQLTVDLSFIAYNHILNLLNTVIVFEIFLQIKNGKWITSLSSASLATYIIHENWIIRQWFFRDLFKEKLFWTSKWMSVHLVITLIGVFLLSFCIEKIRELIFDLSVKRLIDKVPLLNSIYEI